MFRLWADVYGQEFRILGRDQEAPAAEGGFKIRYEAARFWLPEGQEIPVIDSGLMPDPTSSSGAFSYVVEGAEGLAHASAFVLDLKPAA